MGDRPLLVVFDLDDTLCDYAAARRHARTAAEGVLGESGVSRVAFWARYAEVQASLLAALDANVIDRETYELRRFHDALPAATVRRASLAARLRDEYAATVLATLRWLPGARRALHLIAGRCATAVLTNGASTMQRAKLAQLGLPAAASPAVFVSEEIGVSKPDPRAFELVLRACRVQPRDAVMVGDSIAKDLRPAARVGMRTVLVARVRAEAWHAPAIRELTQLPELLGIGAARAPPPA